MSRRRAFIRSGVACLLLAFICVFLGCRKDSNNIAVLNESGNGSTKGICVGDTLQIELRGNPTTGYEWEVGSCDAFILDQVDELEYKQDLQPVSDHPVVGLGGIFTFRFKAIATGQTLLKLVYRRSWEEEPPQDAFEVTVVVQ